MDTTAITSPGFGEDTPGTLIGSYKLIRQLGEGGMGVVYHAQQFQPIRRDVALKVIKLGMDSKQVIARFESERQALAMMDHPNIARVFDASVTPTGRLYFAMELINGSSITQYCDSKRLSVTERIGLLILVCQAIQHAHQKGIIHRDIKPSNILVAEQEGKPVPKVIDFGLAKALGDQLSDASMMTNLGMVVGTPDYMSPEQSELTRHDIDTRSDVYSLGAVLYELLTGTTPLERAHLANATYIEVLQRIREEEPAVPSVRVRQSATSVKVAMHRGSDPTRLPKLLHDELDWIAMKAIEKDRTRRYETVNGLAHDLERYLKGEPVEAAPPSTAYRLRKFIRKHRGWLATGAACTALLVASVVVSSWMAIRASRAEQEAVLERNTAKAVNDFLQNDLLAQASANRQSGPGTKPDPDLKVRTALDRAAARIEGKFDDQPLVEASIRATIGSAYNDLGLYLEAQRQVERALDLQRRKLGEDYRDTLTTMDRLGVLYENQGNYAQAEQLLTRALEGRRRVLGENHPETLLSISSLAVLYGIQGKYAQLEPVFSQILAVRRRVLGEEHPDTLISMNNLAALYHRLGQEAEAEVLFQQVLDRRRRILGPDHPRTLTSMSNLGSLSSDQGKYEQAQQLLTQALEGRRRVLGEEHPDTLVTMMYLGELNSNQGKYAQAEQLLTHVLEGRRRALGEEHPDTLDTLMALGRARLQQQNYESAEAALRESLRGYENSKSETWQRYNCQSMLGASLAGQKQYAKAEPLLMEGYQKLIERRVTIPSGSRSEVEQAGERIVRLYQDWHKPEKAAEWREKLQKSQLAGTSGKP